MNLKSRITGVLATVVLGASLCGGTALADTNTTSATLNMNPNGVCSAAATASTINFGTYHWNGVDSYVTDTPGVLNFNVASTYGPGTGCNVSMTATSLTRVGGGGTISRDDIVWNYTSGAPTVLYMAGYYPAYGIQLIKNGIGPYSGTIGLNGLWGTNYVVGSYTGTLTITSTLGTP